MKTIIFWGSFSLLLFSSCTKTNSENNDSPNVETTTVLKMRRCGTSEAMQKAIAKDPSIKSKREAIENFIQQNEKNIANGKWVLNQLTIPVVVNVLYNTPEENISLAQIQSQIDVLNEDFNGTNIEYNSVPALFSGVKAKINLSFQLVKVNRRFSDKTSWTDESMKFRTEGGIGATSSNNTLNIWVVNKILDGQDEYLGYAYLPGTVPPEYDGLVIGYKYFGRIGPIEAPFDKGRTATHEIGHWMNLEHMWGENHCGNDFVADTPKHDEPNFGCPTYPHLSTCAGKPVEMTMNYMDYSDDACMYMFTQGQKNRARVIFHDGGPRAGFFK